MRRAESDVRPPFYLVFLPVVALAVAVGAGRSGGAVEPGSCDCERRRVHRRHRAVPRQARPLSRLAAGAEQGLRPWTSLASIGTLCAAGDSYNLSFEQPRFLLDRFGTREWVVTIRATSIAHTATRHGSFRRQTSRSRVRGGTRRAGPITRTGGSSGSTEGVAESGLGAPASPARTVGTRLEQKLAEHQFRR